MRNNRMRNNRQAQQKRSPVTACFGISIIALFLAGCVNDTNTGALTSTEIQEKQSTHEQRHVAGKCNSANRLKSSNLASETLNKKFIAYSEVEATLSADRKSAIIAELQSNGSNLEALDANLNTQCVSWSACEFQASTTKQSCSAQKHKFLDAEKQVNNYSKKLAGIKIN